MTDFTNLLLVDDVCTPAGPPASNVEWINVNMLNALGRYRAALENEVALLSEKMGEFSVSAAASGISEPDFEICLPPASAVGFQRLFVPCDIAAYQDYTEPTDTLCSFWFLSGQPGSIGTGSWAPVHPTSRVVGGYCQHCSFQGGLLAQGAPTGCASLVSIWCSICGMPAGLNQSTYILPAFDAPFVLLTQIALLETLSGFEILLRFVIAAVSVLLSRLRRAVIRSEIAIRQRSFFTHHGAHPPRVQPSRAPGLLCGNGVPA